MSDKYDQVAERIQGLYHAGIYAEETDKIATILREAFPVPSVQGEDERALDFGAYVTIEQKRYGVPNEMYLHKVVGRLKSNFYVDVPVQSPAENTPHDGVVEVVACICCGIDESEVKRYRVEDVRPAALRSRLAESGMPMRDEAGWHIQRPEPVQAAPSEDREAIQEAAETIWATVVEDIETWPEESSPRIVLNAFRAMKTERDNISYQWNRDKEELATLRAALASDNSPRAGGHVVLNPEVLVGDIRAAASPGKGRWKMSRKAAGDAIVAFAHNWVKHNPALASERAKREGEAKQKHEMRWIDATPDVDYASRILRAYIDENTSWSDSTLGLPPENPLVVQMNKWQAERNALIKAALEKLASPVPDAAALREASRFIDRLSHQPRPCEVSEGDRDDADYEGGYDCIVREARTIAALLRSEPRGEEGR